MPSGGTVLTPQGLADHLHSVDENNGGWVSDHSESAVLASSPQKKRLVL